MGFTSVTNPLTALRRCIDTIKHKASYDYNQRLSAKTSNALLNPFRKMGRSEIMFRTRIDKCVHLGIKLYL
jgi:hypothetical protein